MMKTLRDTIIAMFVFPLLLVSCRSQEHKSEASEEEHHDEVHLTQQQFDVLRMSLDTLMHRSMGGYVEGSGILSVPPQNKATVTAIVEANVASIEVTAGDEVRKGQVLAYLSHPNIVEMQTKYLKVYSNKVFLKKKYERHQKLYKGGVESGENLQNAESEYEAAQAEIKGLEAQLKLLNINIQSVRDGNIVNRVALLSPISGFVQKVSVNIGQYVNTQTEMFEVINTDHIHADLMVFEKDAYKIKKGQKVSFDENRPGEELIGEIHSIGKNIEDDPKAMRVFVDVENEHKKLIPGEYVKGKILINNEVAVALPQGAIVKSGDRYYAFTVEQEDDLWAFTPVEVVLGAKDGDWVAVQFPVSVVPGTLFAYNNAYYLISEMKKSETEHSH